MTSTDQSAAVQEPLVRAWLRVAGYYVGRKRILVLLAAGLTAAGLVLNWNWLVAAGIAPVLISLLPCAAMCALGLCMKGAGANSCSAKEPGEAHDTASVASPADLARVATPPIAKGEASEIPTGRKTV